MLGQWCAAGLPYADFWPLCFSEIITVLDGEHKRRTREHDDARARNYELAGLISFAHHDPKKMPKFQATGAAEKEQSDAVNQAKVRGYLISLALHSGKGKP